MQPWSRCNDRECTEMTVPIGSALSKCTGTLESAL